MVTHSHPHPARLRRLRVKPDHHHGRFLRKHRKEHVVQAILALVLLGGIAFIFHLLSSFAH